MFQIGNLPLSFEIVNQPGLQTKPENWCFTEGCFFKRVEIQWEKRKFTRKIKNSAIERPCKVNLDKEAVVNANKNLSQHPSIWKIKETTNFSACFSFHTVSKENILYQLHSLDPTISQVWYSNEYYEEELWHIFRVSFCKI